MKRRRSLTAYAKKYGVSRASRKYNQTRPSVCFWLGRCDGSLQWPRHPHSRPNQHTGEELKRIADMGRRNPDLGIAQLWARMRKPGDTPTVESLRRVMGRPGPGAVSLIRS